MLNHSGNLQQFLMRFHIRKCGYLVSCVDWIMLTSSLFHRLITNINAELNVISSISSKKDPQVTLSYVKHVHEPK